MQQVKFVLIFKFCVDDPKGQTSSVFMHTFIIFQTQCLQSGANWDVSHFESLLRLQKLVSVIHARAHDVALSTYIYIIFLFFLFHEEFEINALLEL